MREAAIEVFQIILWRIGFIKEAAKKIDLF
jgi:hypothetical protein